MRAAHTSTQVAEEMRTHMAAMGFRTVNEMVRPPLVPPPHTHTHVDHLPSIPLALCGQAPVHAATA